jgi:hypothetical protein
MPLIEMVGSALVAKGINSLLDALSSSRAEISADAESWFVPDGTPETVGVGGLQVRPSSEQVAQLVASSLGRQRIAETARRALALYRGAVLFEGRTRLSDALLNDLVQTHLAAEAEAEAGVAAGVGKELLAASSMVCLSGALSVCNALGESDGVLREYLSDMLSIRQYLALQSVLKAGKFPWGVLPRLVETGSAPALLLLSTGDRAWRSGVSGAVRRVPREVATQLTATFGSLLERDAPLPWTVVGEHIDDRAWRDSTRWTELLKWVVTLPDASRMSTVASVQSLVSELTDLPLIELLLLYERVNKNRVGATRALVEQRESVRGAQ